jgi:hypothetical protein
LSGDLLKKAHADASRAVGEMSVMLEIKRIPRPELEAAIERLEASLNTLYEIRGTRGR